MPLPNDDDEQENYRFPSQEELDDADARPDTEDADFIRCPRCKKNCHSETVSCPHCKHYLMEDQRNRKPLWFVITAYVVAITLGLPTLLGAAWIIWQWWQH